jgi:hypothetical protein
MNLTIVISDIRSAVLAADAMSAALDRAPETLTIINPDLDEALTKLIEQALPLVIAPIAHIVSAYTIDNDAISITTNVDIDISLALRSALTWRTLQLCYVGCNSVRATYCANVADSSLAAYKSCSATCPPQRPEHYL